MSARTIAITVKHSKGTDAEFDPRFGRADAFRIVNIETNKVLFEIVNDAANAAQGAGTEAAAIMSRNGVEAVISGRFGPKAHQALEALGIEMWIAPDGITAAKALERLANGELQKMEITRY
jgi:predicted Fe-Mo cluster-binding NifX family protein